MQPGGVLVGEEAVGDDGETLAALQSPFFLQKLDRFYGGVRGVDADGELLARTGGVDQQDGVDLGNGVRLGQFANDARLRDDAVRLVT